MVGSIAARVWSCLERARSVVWEDAGRARAQRRAGASSGAFMGEMVLPGDGASGAKAHFYGGREQWPEGYCSLRWNRQR